MKHAKLDSERRRFRRVMLDAHVNITMGQNHWTGELIDVSLNGALVTRPTDWNVANGQRVVLVIQLTKDTAINMEAHIAHGDDQVIGFACEEIDIESISHLRRIIELNLGDAELMYREIQALGHLQDN